MAIELPLGDLPVLLSKAEALDHAAQRLKAEAAAVEMAAVILGSIKPADEAALPPEIAKLLQSARKSLVDPKLQAAAMRSASQAIREMALEERVVAAHHP